MLFKGHRVQFIEETSMRVGYTAEAELQAEEPRERAILRNESLQLLQVQERTRLMPRVKSTKCCIITNITRKRPWFWTGITYVN